MIAAPLKIPLSVGLWLRFKPRVLAVWALIQPPGVGSQSADERVTTPKPQSLQNWRLVRKRCGVTTMAIASAVRTGPMPGSVPRILEIRCRGASSSRRDLRLGLQLRRAVELEAEQFHGGSLPNRDPQPVTPQSAAWAPAAPEDSAPPRWQPARPYSPVTNSRMSRQARTMSTTVPRSRCLIEDPGGFEDRLATNPVAALFNGLPVDQIHFSAQQPGELSFEFLEMCHPGLLGSTREAREEVQVAVGVALLAQGRTEDRELVDAELPAESPDLAQGQMIDWLHAHGQTSRVIQLSASVLGWRSVLWAPTIAPIELRYVT